MSKISYRPEIDGFRALAVLSVLFYHAGFEHLSGGYIGVDIFFAISGYLITSIIYSELNTNSFSFKSFWLRRARRILPAAFVVMATTACVFAVVYPAPYYRDFGKSLAAQSLFSANIYFWTASGYFESSAELKPLLHTWSLAVEEQFYLLFPFVLWLSYRYSKAALIPLVLIGSLISFCISVFGAYDYTDATFYLLPARAWELGAGALLGLASPSIYSNNSRINNVVSAGGLAIILYALFTFNRHTPFPSYNAALPVLGTCALIWANTNTRTLVGRFFCLKPVVGIGLISYSLYLWHWPVIVFCNWVFSPQPSLVYTLTLFALSTTLAYLSYKLVENPLRVNRNFFTNRKVVLGSMITSAITLIMGISAVYIGNSGWVDPDGKIEHYYSEALNAEPNRNNSNCSKLILTKATITPCQYQGNSSTETIDIFVWGDSHGSALMPAFENLALKERLNVTYATRNGCQPVAGMHRVDSNHYCSEFSSRVMKSIISTKPKVVVLVGSFVNNISAGKFRDAEAPLSISATEAHLEFDQKIKETVSSIKKSGAKIAVFTEPPRLNSDPVSGYLRKKTLGLNIEETYTDKPSHIARTRTIYGIIDKSGIDLRLDFTDFFCNDLKCNDQYKKKSLYKDASHISNFGARSLSSLIGKNLNTLME